MTPEQIDMLKETHESVISILQLLKGFNGTKGLCADFEDHKKQDVIFRAKFYAFRLQVIIVLVAAASGGGFGLAKVLEMVK